MNGARWDLCGGRRATGVPTTNDLRELKVVDDGLARRDLCIPRVRPKNDCQRPYDGRQKNRPRPALELHHAAPFSWQDSEISLHIDRAWV